MLPRLSVYRVRILLVVLLLSACGQFSISLQPQNSSDIREESSPPPTAALDVLSPTTGAEPGEAEALVDDAYLSRLSLFPPSDGNKWVIYENVEHGFAFQYPDRWQLMEIPGTTREQRAPSPWADAVLLKNGVYELIIWFNKTSEDRSFLKMMDRGDRFEEGTIDILGESLPIIAIQSDESTTAILYGDEHFWVGDLHFSIALVDTSNGQEAAPEIPPSVKNEVAKMLGSLVAAGVDYTPPLPERIVDNLPCIALDESDAWWVICNMRDGLRSGNVSTLPQWMTNPFALGYWGSEWTSRSPYEVVEELKNVRLPANTGTLTFTHEREAFPPLAGIPPEGMLGPEDYVSQVVYSEGWGAEGYGAALLLFGPDSAGETKLKAIVLSHQHFDK